MPAIVEVVRRAAKPMGNPIGRGRLLVARYLARRQRNRRHQRKFDYLAGIIADLERGGFSRIDVTPEAERSWAAEVDMVSRYTVHRLADSWYNGRNIEGKQGGFMIYIGGFPRFAKLCEEAIRNGYEGFVRT